MSDAAQPPSRVTPDLAEPEAVSPYFTRLREAADEGANHAAALLASYAEDEDVAGLLDEIFPASPYLSELIVRDPDFAREFLIGDDGAAFERILTDLGEQMRTAEDAAQAKKTLRRAKAHSALLIAIADLSGSR